MKSIKKTSAVFILTFLLMCFTGMAGTNQVADVSIGSYGVSFMPKVDNAGILLTVSRPDGTVFSKTFPAGSMPYFDLGENSGAITNGSYTFELRVIPNITRVREKGKNLASVKSLDNPYEKPLIQSGTFTVKGGAIVTGVASEPGEQRARPMTQGDPASPLDQVILDDLIVDGSICVGFDCVNGENFGFDTLRLKENNLRIKFQDTSTSASFPSNDWQITANDSSNGGANKFSIDDIDGGRTPFTIEASAPSHSLYVDDGGRIGFGTSTPVAQLHVKDGNTPTLRLEQDGSSGFTPQTWDVAGNEANFFIRDATNGSELPFRIVPGAPSNSIYIASSGYLALGHTSPDTIIHAKNASNPAIRAEYNGGARIQMQARSDKGNFGVLTAHKMNLVTNGDVRLTIDENGNVGIGEATPDYPIEVGTANGARLETSGNWVNPSSRELKENIETLTSEEAINTLNGLNPVKYNYKVDKTEGYVGFISEDVPELVAVKDRKGLVTMDVVAILTKVVKEQQKMAQEQQETIAKLNKRIAELEKKINSDDKK